MRLLLLTSFLFLPSIVFGGIGDIYYCNTKKVIQIKNSKLKKFQNFNFKFKRNQNSLKFGSQKNYFSKSMLPKLEFQSDEWFVYNGDLGMTVFYHREGNFTYSLVGNNEIDSISGSCSIF